jgi:hypothetical protein
MNAERERATQAIVARPSHLLIERTSTADDAIERAVRDLNAICRAATLDFALAVGAFVIDRFYAGDLARWRSRDATKQDSLRRLARHPDLAMHPGCLYRSVAMYELGQRIGIPQCRRISTSHLRLVLPLLPPQQERLLRETEEAGWSVRRLEEEVRAVVQRDPAARTTRGGRKRHSRLTGAVQAIQKCGDALNEFLAADFDGEVPSSESARAALGALRAVRQACTRMERRLENYLPAARTTPPPAMDDEPDGPAVHPTRGALRIPDPVE